MKLKTSHSLVVSLVSMLLTLLMLASTTFAWFSDTVESGRNVIRTGNLDLVVEYSFNGDSWEMLEPDDELFNENGDAVYEPGYTEFVYLRLANAGQLNFNYQTAIKVYEENIGTNKKGDPIKLSDIIKIGVLEGESISDVKLANREAAIDIAKTSFESNKTLTTSVGPLAPRENNDEYTYIALVIHMPTTVGSEANHDGQIGHIPGIEFAVSILATQAEVEADDFGTNYDTDAGAVVTVNSADDLLSAIEDGNDVILTGDVTLDEGSSFVIPEDENVIIDLAGNTLTNAVKAGGALVNNGELTIKGGTIVNENIEEQKAAAIVNGEDGVLTLVNVNSGSDLNRGAAVQNNGGIVNIDGGFFATMDRSHASDGYAYVFINQSGTMNIRNATVSGRPNGVFYAAAGTINVDGGSYEIKSGANTWYMAYADYGATINLNSGTYIWNEGPFCGNNPIVGGDNVNISDECIINW
ncbi:MAG: hypothetical protein J6V93_03325 [Clostridia bacterium]|nr:hypothetical protein [Clostridia bacterium]